MCALVLGSVASMLAFSFSGPGSTAFTPERLEISGGRATPPVVDPTAASAHRV